ncbi:SAM-dependent methyltransferase, partial [Mycobacterium tuberculosis]|nr:SAM-dependent methyltransferase [Mycobacterium tuberculosis]
MFGSTAERWRPDRAEDGSVARTDDDSWDLATGVG